MRGERAESIREQKDAQRSLGFEIRVDKGKIAQTEGIPDEMKEWLLRLPETLSFDESITLIVGDNGSGKTQFARAVLTSLAENREGADARSHGILLDREEPAVKIAEALTPTEAPKGNLISTFIEGAEVMFKSREWAKDQARWQRAGNKGSQTEHRLSSRQLFEQSIEIIRKVRIDEHRERVFAAIDHMGNLDPLETVSGDVVIIFDEPEQGLSWERQLKLPEMLTDFLKDDDVLFVPTNNLVLYLSDMPRLDLEHPERGIHRPSEYGEGGTIELHGADKSE